MQGEDLNGLGIRAPNVVLCVTFPMLSYAIPMQLQFRTPVAISSKPVVFLPPKVAEYITNIVKYKICTLEIFGLTLFGWLIIILILIKLQGCNQFGAHICVAFYRMA